MSEPGNYLLMRDLSDSDTWVLVSSYASKRKLLEACIEYRKASAESGDSYEYSTWIVGISGLELLDIQLLDHFINGLV